MWIADRFERMGRRWQRALAWAVVCAVFVGGLYRVENTSHRTDVVARDAAAAAEAAQEALERLEAQQVRMEAERCVQAWAGRLGVRALMEAIIAAAAGARPEVIAALRADMAERLPDPECDLAAAERIAGP